VDPSLLIGGSTRASLALMRASRVVAASEGREDVYPDDVRRVLTAVLAHRLALTPDAQLRDETVDKVIERVSGRVKPPMAIEAGSARREDPEAALVAAADAQ
jgi:MoxR-like ATPase